MGVVGGPVAAQHAAIDVAGLAAPGYSGAFPLADVVLNYNQDSAGAASLTNIAHAIAAREWHALHDRMAGSAEFGVKSDGKYKVVGWISAVRHVFTRTGKWTVRYDLPGRIAPFAWMRYAGASVLRIVGRIINPGK